MITASYGFIVYYPQVTGNKTEWLSLLAKPVQLRMVQIALCAPPQHSLGQQRLAPQSDETGRVQVLGMQTPYTHGRDYTIRTAKSFACGMRGV